MRRRSRLLLGGVLVAAALLAPAGASASDIQPKIVGGGTASTATYPWQSALVISSSKLGGNAHQRQFCGGSLLTSRIVITAGHCVWNDDPDPNCFLICSTAEVHLDADDVKVILGHDTLSTTPASAELPVIGVSWDPNFQFQSGVSGVPNYDVAYLVLGSASAQGQIKIAGADEGALWDAGSYAEISGWGSTVNGGGTQDTLRSAAVSINPDSSCTSSYPGDFNAATMVCANGPGTDSCTGDSGGPLEAPIEGGGYRLVGITGWGRGCGDAGNPGVYTRVAGPTMGSLIQSDVSNLDATFGLPTEPIFGSGALPKGTTSPTTKSANAANTKKRCKRIHNKRKRRRCTQKHKHHKKNS